MRCICGTNYRKSDFKIVKRQLAGEATQTPWLVDDIRIPNIRLGQPGDFDTPTLPCFEVDIGLKVSSTIWDGPGWYFVMEGEYPRAGGCAQRRSIGAASEIRVDIDLHSDHSDSILVEVHGSRNWRGIVKRAIERAYYQRAVTARGTV